MTFFTTDTLILPYFLIQASIFENVKIMGVCLTCGVTLVLCKLCFKDDVRLFDFRFLYNVYNRVNAPGN